MAQEEEKQEQSSYLNYLPAVFQRDVDEVEVLFIGRLLRAFEGVLSGLRDPERPGLEEIVDRIHTYFDPGPGKNDSDRAPAEFLEWLASWVALSLREDWDEEQKRRFIRQVVPLYRWRGTKRGLEQMLGIYTGGKATITIMEDDSRPHYFLVRLSRTEEGWAYNESIAVAIIDQEKPAHTYYHIERVSGDEIGLGGTPSP